MRRLLSYFVVLSSLGAALGAATPALAAPAPTPANLGAEAPTPNGFSLETSEHFRVVHNTQRDWVLARLTLLEKTYDRFFAAFGAGPFGAASPSAPLGCTVFQDREQFNRHALATEGLDMSWSGGYYSGRTNRVALFVDRPAHPDHLATPPVPYSPALAMQNPLGRHPSDLSPSAPSPPRATDRSANYAKITHEAAHQLAFNSGLQKRRVMYPLWASEGLATNFEAEDAASPFGPTAANPTRHGHLRRALADGRFLPLADFVTLTRVPVGDTGDISAVYAQAWACFRFLYQHCPDALGRYYRALANLEPGARDPRTLRREFTDAFGPLDRLEPAWQQFLRDLK